jgi:hypothetical protein
MTSPRDDSSGVSRASNQPKVYPMKDLSGKIIDEQPCPRCELVRTVRVGSSKDFFCLHCGLRWDSHSARTNEGEEPLEESLAGLFTSQQVQRLYIYRDAVRAGFYRDW